MNNFRPISVNSNTYNLVSNVAKYKNLSMNKTIEMIFEEYLQKDKDKTADILRKVRKPLRKARLPKIKLKDIENLDKYID